MFRVDCGSRLSVANNKGTIRIVYPYFHCLGRQRYPSLCDQKVILIDVAEATVLEHYRSLYLSANSGTPLACRCHMTTSRFGSSLFWR